MNIFLKGSDCDPIAWQHVHIFYLVWGKIPIGADQKQLYFLDNLDSGDIIANFSASVVPLSPNSKLSTHHIKIGSAGV